MPTRVGFRLRSLAFIVDFTLALLLSVLFGPWVGWRLGLEHVAGGPGTGGMMAGALAGGALLGLLYFLSEGIVGMTPGKRLLGLRIGTDEGHVAPVPQYLLRWAVKQSATLLALFAVVVSLVLPGLGGWLALLSNLAGLVVLVGCFLALRPDKQALHDRLAATAVFRRGELLPLEEDEEAYADD